MKSFISPENLRGGGGADGRINYGEIIERMPLHWLKS